MFTTRRCGCVTIFMVVMAIGWNFTVFLSLFVSFRYIINANALHSWERQQCIVEQVHEHETLGCWGGCWSTRSSASRRRDWHDEPHLLVHL